MIPAAADDMGQGQPSTCFGLLHNLANLRQLRLWDIKGLPTPETLECLSGLRHLVVVDVRALLPLQVKYWLVQGLCALIGIFISSARLA